MLYRYYVATVKVGNARLIEVLSLNIIEYTEEGKRCVYYTIV